MSLILSACVSVPEDKRPPKTPVWLPYLRMEAGECYYLDDFLPTPDSLVTGRTSGLWLRYYTYREAVYKTWNGDRVMLAFYSRDNRCWSLFEEYASS